MKAEAVERCRVVPVGTLILTIPRKAELSLGHRRRLLDAVVYSAAGIPDAARSVLADLEDRLGVTDFDRAQLGLFPMDVLKDRASAAKRRQLFARKEERKRAETLRQVDDFAPLDADLKRLGNAQNAMAEAQRLFAQGALEPARDAMLKAKEDALKAETDHTERRRKAWLTKALAESAALEKERGGYVVEQQVKDPLPGERRVVYRRLPPDAFAAMRNALGATGAKQKDGRPVLNLILGQRRYTAGLRYRELVECAGIKLKSGMSFGAGGSASMDGLADARAHVLLELERLEFAAEAASGAVGLALLRIVVGQGRSIRSLEAPGSAQEGLKASLLKALDAVVDAAGGSARSAVQSFTEHLVAAPA